MQRILALLSLLPIISVLFIVTIITLSMGEVYPSVHPASVVKKNSIVTTSTNPPHNSHAVAATGNATNGTKTSTSTQVKSQPLLGFLHQHHHQYSTSISLSNITFLTYVNPKFDIKMQFPSNWLKQENGTTSNRITNIVTFLSPPANKSDIHRASLDVSIDNISDARGISLAKYVTNTITGLKSSYKDFKLLGSTIYNTASAVAGNRAYDLAFRLNDPSSGIVQVLEMGTIAHDKAYILEYSSQPSKYFYYLPIIRHMIGSFVAR